MKNKFLKSAALLAVSGLLCKLLGAIYRIPLANAIGSEGMGCYQMAYPIYTLLLTVSSAGVPIAVSKMVSEELALGFRRRADEIFRVSLAALLVVGAVSAALLYFAAKPAAAAMGLPEAAFSLQMLAPSLVFVAAVSAYRGCLQGRQLMGATAVSQLSEQLVRLTAGLWLARAWMARGAAYGSGGALLGVTLSELFGLLVIMAYYAVKRREFALPWQADRARIKEILSRLWRLAFPVTLGACAAAVTGAIDSAVVMRVLTAAGRSDASSLFGLLTGFVQPIVNMPAVLFASVAMAIVPALSAELASGSIQDARRHANMAYNITLVISVPCAVGLFILAKPLLAAMFSSLNGAELELAARLMRILAPSVLFMATAQVTTGILQGAGRTVWPVLSLLMGSAVKLYLGIALIRIEGIGIAGAAIGTLICFAIVAVVNTLLSTRFTGMRPDWKKLLPIAVSSAGMACAALGVRALMSGIAGTVCAVLSGAAVYAILIVITRGVDKDELRLMLPSRKRRRRGA